tara:strand:+ start:38258 stop:38734 length:477 start_codon:yes stop_codon:yes gene_type:complete
MTAALEYFNKTNDELAAELLALKKEQFNLRFQKASGQLENTARIRQVRRDIAKVKTVLGMRDASGNPLPGVKLPKPANEAAAKPKKAAAKKPAAKKEAAPAEDKKAEAAPKKAAAKKAPAKKAAAKTDDKPKKAPAKKAATKSKATKKDAADAAETKE